MTIQIQEPGTAPEPTATAHTSVLRRVLRDPTAVISLAFLALIVLSAVFAPLLTAYDPNTASAKDVLAPPSAAHWLGGDGSGHDVLARLLFAGRVSLAAAALAVGVAAVLGVTAGLIAGYFGRWLESLAGWVTSLLQALPAIIVLLAAAAVLGPSVWTAMLIFGILLAPAFYRVVYAAASGVRNELYVDAARVSGLSDVRIIGRHVLTVVRAPVIILIAMLGGLAIAIESGLDFLGLGDPVVPTWGNLLNDGFTHIYQTGLLVVWPAVVIGLTCVALVLVGNATRDALERSSQPARRVRRSPPHARSLRATTAPEAAAEAVVVHGDDEPARDPLLIVDRLAVGYAQPDGALTTVVHDVSLVVAKGEVHGLIGESGSGKTQTAWSILRLLPARGRILAGSVLFDGVDLVAQSDRGMRELLGTRIAYIPQEPMANLDPSFTVRSQLVEPMRIKLGLSRRDAGRRAAEWLDRVGIPNPQRTLAAYPHELSGGMAQRVLIAAAVCCEPDLLIADEPTTALDVTVQADVLDLLRDLQTELRMAMVLVTHNFGVVADLCNRVSVMRNGRIVETGPVRSIFRDPRHEYTRSLFAAILDGGEARGSLPGLTSTGTLAEGLGA